MVEVALLNNEGISAQTLDGYGRRAPGSKVLLEWVGSEGENSKCLGCGCFLALGHLVLGSECYFPPTTFTFTSPTLPFSPHVLAYSVPYLNQWYLQLSLYPAFQGDSKMQGICTECVPRTAGPSE